jgi:hypothetical protein
LKLYRTSHGIFGEELEKTGAMPRRGVTRVVERSV